MTLLATKQIQLQVDKSLEPKLEVLLAQKVRTTALKTKPFRKEQTFNVKFNTQSSNTREHFAKIRNAGEEISFSENYKSGPTSVFGTVSRKQYEKQ